MPGPKFQAPNPKPQIPRKNYISFSGFGIWDLGFLFFLLLFVADCGSTRSRKPESAKAVSEKGGSLYYYLVSQLENIRGKEDSSLFYLEKSLKKNPGSPFLLTQKAYQLARKNRLDDALGLAEKALAKAPNDAAVNVLLGKIYTSQNRSARAISHYERGLSADPNNEETINLLAREYLGGGQTGKAIDVLKSFIARNPELESATHHLGNIYVFHLKDYPKAVALYEGLLALQPDEPRILRILAEIFLAQKNYGKALEAFRKVVTLQPQDLNSLVRIGLLQYEQKNFDGAIATFKSILNQSPKADRVLYYLGLLHQQKKDDEAAIRYYNQINPPSDHYSEAIVRQAVLLRNLKQSDKAFALAKEAVQKKPKIPDFYDLLSSLYIMDRDYAKAIAVLRDGIKQIPNNEPLLFALGVAYEKMGDWEKSIDAMRQVLALNQENAMALNFVGYTYAERALNLDEAHALIEKALKLKPNDGFIVDSLGWLHFQQGDLQKALSLVEKANALSPNEPTILEHLGEIHLKKKDKRRALYFFELSLFQLRKKEDKDGADERQIKRIEEKIGNL